MQLCFFTGVSFLSYVMFQGDSNKVNILEYVQSEGNGRGASVDSNQISFNLSILYHFPEVWTHEFQ